MNRAHLYGLRPTRRIEAHPKGVGDAFGTEVWLYRHVEEIGHNGTVTFLDKLGEEISISPGNVSIGAK
jgi:hypothetical protein